MLLTDGEDNDEGALEAAQNAAKEGLKIFTIGIGSAEGTLVQVKDANGNTDYIRDEQGQVLKSKLNESLLQQIATVTGGFYLPLRGGNTIATLYERGLAPMPKSEGTEKLIKNYHEQFQWPMGAAILLLLAEMFCRNESANGKFRRATPHRAGQTFAAAKAAGALVLFTLLGVSRQSFRFAGRAWRDYTAGNYTNALEEYERLAAIHTNDLRLVFNAGVAAYRATNYEAAATLFTAVTLSPDLKLQQQAYYNLGNTQYRLSDVRPRTLTPCKRPGKRSSKFMNERWT